ncbi:MAG: ANTAR domain-containing protein [Oscillospiraceae bacterium]|nr:ANTAR domain-containing protein [Oscillospiraceae bacterium]MBQ9696891.1 ANTAR domain-containing protein [Oscillospiraceae bacterium]MBR1897676.1 ANTAR domain-containing protein [Oscillospiraceae bacterium]
MEQILILSGSNGAAESLEGFLKSSFQCSIKTLPSAYQARSILEQDHHTELVVIHAPLIDESGVELAQYITRHTNSNCILLLKQEQAEQLAWLSDHHQVIVLGRPVNKQILYQLIRTMEIVMQRCASILEDNARLEQKLRDIRTIDRAKFLMMQYQGMTEEQAHSYLEKYAMDNRKRKPIAAMEIIDRINEQYL